jgi:uncharacterized metal-binding protein
MKLLLRSLRIPKIFDKHSDLISNVAINKLLSPFYFIGIFSYLYFHVKLPMLGKSLLKGSLSLSIISTFIYVWCSYYFQPDLDVRKMRPGINMFPFGSSIMNSPIGLMILPFQKVLAKGWYYLWHPYALFFTHRGITHWPIVSTYLRIFYLQIWLAIFIKAASVLSLTIKPIVQFNLFLEIFYPASPFFLKPIWIIFCLPVFLVDIFHEIIDFIDSKRKGLSYCPPQIPRGYLANSVELIKKLLITKT